MQRQQAVILTTDEKETFHRWYNALRSAASKKLALCHSM